MSLRKPVRLVATARQYYGGRFLLPGDTFDTNDAEAADLIAMNFARAVQVPALFKAPSKASEPEALPQTEPPAQPRRGRYARRDMRAVDK